MKDDNQIQIVLMCTVAQYFFLLNILYGQIYILKQQMKKIQIMQIPKEEIYFKQMESQFSCANCRRYKLEILRLQNQNSRLKEDRINLIRQIQSSQLSNSQQKQEELDTNQLSYLTVNQHQHTFQYSNNYNQKDEKKQNNSDVFGESKKDKSKKEKEAKLLQNLLNISEITAESNFMSSLKIQAKKVKFTPRKTVIFCTKFSFNQGVVTKGISDKKFQLVAQMAISKSQRQAIGIKIIKSQKGVIYFGLIAHERIDEDYSAKVLDGNIISYKTIGGRQLIVGKNLYEGKVSRINEGQKLIMVVDYQKSKIIWFNNSNQIVTITVDFKGDDWYPFVTMETPKDAIELL